MSANKRYGRQIILSLVLTVFIILGLLYLAARFLLPHVDVNQQQVYDVLIKIFPLLLGLIMIEIGVLVARRRDEEITEEADTLPPNAYDRPLHTLPGDDPIHPAYEELSIGSPVAAAAAVAAIETPAPVEAVATPVIEPVTAPVVEEPVVEAPLEAAPEPVIEPEVAAVAEPFEEEIVEEEIEDFVSAVAETFAEPAIEEEVSDFVSAVAEAYEAYDEIEAVDEYVAEEYIDEVEEEPYDEAEEYAYADEEQFYDEDVYADSDAYEALEEEEDEFYEEPISPATLRLEEAIAQLTQTVRSLESTIGGMQNLRIFTEPVAEELVVPTPMPTPTPVAEPVVAPPVVEPVVEAAPVVVPEPVAPVAPVVPVTPVAAAPAVAEEDLIDLADFDAVLAYELETAADFAYDLTIAVISIGEGPVARVTEKLVNESHDFAFSFTREDGSVALILSFYNEEEARAFTLPLVESCEREYAPASLQVGFASRNGRTVEPAELVAEAERRQRNIS